MIRIGNQTSFAAAPTEPFEYALQHGFDAFEWFPDKHSSGAGWDEHDLSPATREQIRKAARTHGLRLSVHARWQANPLEPAAESLFAREVALAHEIGAVLINIHLIAGEGIDAYVRALMPWLERAATAGLELSIENTPLTGPAEFNELFAALRSRRPPALEQVGMCFDLGHANLCAATRNDYLGFVDQLDSEVPINHLHLHENYGDFDSHLTLFTGPASRDTAGICGLIERVLQRGFSGSIILEQWPQPASLLDQARDRLREMLSTRIKGDRGGRENLNPPDQPELRSPSHQTSPSRKEFPEESHALNPGIARVGTCPTASVEGIENKNLDAIERVPTTDALDRGMNKLKATGPDPFTDRIVAADQRCRSWREKLDFIRAIICEQHGGLAVEELAEVAVYLQFLATGEVRCEEDGRHFRPSHHAKISREIQTSLEGIATPANAFLLRKILRRLPSSNRTFRSAEPLTRIRDIAHRNDIPSDFKREIKQTLQNKLHRCAGPEDLKTSAALLQRITAPGAKFATAFIEQFKVFHHELTEFFNAASLEWQLEQIARTVDAKVSDPIRDFLRAKLSIDRGFEQQLSALEALTELRIQFTGRNRLQFKSEVQDILLADIGLEDFCFVLLSQLINSFDSLEGKPCWKPLWESLILVLRNLIASEIELEESRALHSELKCWVSDFDPADPEALLRVQASVERTQRLAEDFSERVLALFSSGVERLGRALGVSEMAIRVFCEAEIRSHFVFQLSKLSSHILRRLREELAAPPWDILVTGHVAGRVRVANSLAELTDTGPTIALLRKAEGDEEIPANIAGLILAHQMPHLSHLAVRARQRGVVVAACEEQTLFREFASWNGSRAVLDVTVARVELIRTDDSERESGATNLPSPQHMAVPPVSLTQGRSILPLDAITSEMGGPKSIGAKRLAELAAQTHAPFQALPGWVVPFAVFERALANEPAICREYKKIIETIDDRSVADFCEATARLRTLIAALTVPNEIATEMRKRLGPNSRLMARSNSNCEDLLNFSGAGLYDSVPNVALSEVATAVRNVWASLWTARAASSRQQSGISHEQAHMSVLIQPMLAPEFSFILHTVNPLNRNEREFYAELAVGLGETLASGETKGSPYRLTCDKQSGAVRMLAFANFSASLTSNAETGIVRKTINYAGVRFSTDRAARVEFATRLAAVVQSIEAAFGCPQDIEGAVVGDDIYVVQTRAQQGL